MLTRRRFAALTALAALEAPLKLRAAATRSGLEFGAQIYTLRKMQADLGAKLELIHSIGYASVELGGDEINLPARELKAIIAEHGLKAPSGHFAYETLEDRVDYAAELGLEYMICPVIPRADWNSLDGFRRAAEHLSKVSAKVRAAGLKLGYHPHNYEFKPQEGSSGFAVLMKELDPAVRLELDVYWATEAGQNPLELMRKNRARLELLHIKDRKPVEGHSFVPNEQAAHFVEVGSGTIDWKAVLGEARRLGVKQYIVEQDETDLPFDQCLRTSWNYLSQLSL
jgi:sugar phosphate isomerase/epimerase